ncbi:hypothetical protein Tsp_00700 [Trichinella spiralis]|uniref:hypothetical protein n=1 Tax=Trichinella spiralis TaxID=6334 RepID=UPI0001EFC657|nr:hypothetical protein Tsp_00700 [Trichinella spiralis]
MIIPDPLLARGRRCQRHLDDSAVAGIVGAHISFQPRLSALGMSRFSVSGRSGRMTYMHQSTGIDVPAVSNMLPPSFVLPLQDLIQAPPEERLSPGKVSRSSKSALRFPRLPLVPCTTDRALQRADSGVPCR